MKTAIRWQSSPVRDKSSQLEGLVSQVHIDTIIVPTVRLSENLGYAITLAAESSTLLLVLCSGKASVSEVINRAFTTSARVVAISVPKHFHHHLLTFNTDTFPEAMYGRTSNDLSMKRNLGLILGRLVGWERIFFLDDDTRGLTKQQLEQVASSLSDNAVAGFSVTSFPDNSVVRHAERLSGKDPGVSLSGGALGINSLKVKSFFPNIYNEDWFFLYGSDRSIFGEVVQLPYDPFSDPLRAASEEFGDVVAEGIMQLLASGIDIGRASLADWERLLALRKILIGDIRARLIKQGSKKLAALCALQEAEKRLDAIRAKTCFDYVTLWRNDWELWEHRLVNLRSEAFLDQALQLLGLEYLTTRNCGL